MSVVARRDPAVKAKIDVIEKSCLLILESRQCRYSHASHACLYCAAHFRMLP